jgi:hypothetical protein
MYDQDPSAESEEKCDYCELWDYCTTRLKDRKDICCFEPNGPDGESSYEQAFGKKYEREPDVEVVDPRQIPLFKEEK